jgi:hypothetical protein
VMSVLPNAQAQLRAPECEALETFQSRMLIPSAHIWN